MDSARPHPNPTHTPHHKGMNSINFAFGLVMAKKKPQQHTKKREKLFQKSNKFVSGAEEPDGVKDGAL